MKKIVSTKIVVSLTTQCLLSQIKSLAIETFSLSEHSSSLGDDQQGACANCSYSTRFVSSRLGFSVRISYINTT
jgi:hypothetical protein